MADINVLMMGGRRAGKTSVLAAMSSCCRTILNTIPNINVTREEGGVSLTNKEAELNRYFSELYMNSMSFTADLEPTANSDTYSFEVTVNERNAGYTLNFTDFPGEWLSRSDKEEELQKMVDMSQIIMIAIDTPHMVESMEDATRVGKYHKEFNRVAEITRFLKNAFQKSKQERMILFVPLKCEKYYYRNKMKMVNETLKKGYADLLSFLSNDELKNLCTVGIVPILTIGGAEFYKFSDNGYAGEYSYVRDMTLRKYNPKYCEQPLFLTLYYLIKMSEKKAKGGFLPTWFKVMFFNQVKLDDLVKCRAIIEKLVERDFDLGFEILQNPLGV